MVPAVTLSMLLIGRLERFSMPVLLAIVAITLGTGLTAVMEVLLLPSFQDHARRRICIPSRGKGLRLGPSVLR